MRARYAQSSSLNRRTRVTRDEAGVIQKFGVPPASIPDYLALVGDAADGYPGLPGWGAKSTAAVLAKFGHLESIPADWREWGVNAANAERPRTDPLARARSSAAVPNTSHASNRHPAFRGRGRTAMERSYARIRSTRGAIRRGSHRIQAGLAKPWRKTAL